MYAQSSSHAEQTGFASAWERAFYAFLAEKERRSRAKRTVDAYSGTLRRFFGTLGKPPDQVSSQEVFVFADGRCLSGRERWAVDAQRRSAPFARAV